MTAATGTGPCAQQNEVRKKSLTAIMLSVFREGPVERKHARAKAEKKRKNTHTDTESGVYGSC